jgi:hypothetical protein
LKWADFSPEAQTKIASKVQSEVSTRRLEYVTDLFHALTKLSADKSIISAEALKSVSQKTTSDKKDNKGILNFNIKKA